MLGECRQFCPHFYSECSILYHLCGLVREIDVSFIKNLLFLSSPISIYYSDKSNHVYKPTLEQRDHMVILLKNNLECVFVTVSLFVSNQISRSTAYSPAQY